MELYRGTQNQIWMQLIVYKTSERPQQSSSIQSLPKGTLAVVKYAFVSFPATSFYPAVSGLQICNFQVTICLTIRLPLLTMSLSSVALKTSLPYFPYFKIRWKHMFFTTLYKMKTSFLFFHRSLVEDDDAHMKVALGYGDMGISAHLQASKTGNTRFFTSNTHSSVVLQVRVQK